MKVRMLFAFLMLWAVNIASQEFSIDVTPKKVKVLPGAPVSLSVTLTNDSHKDLWICGKELKNGIRSGGAILIDVAGQELSCTQSGESASSTGAFPNAPIKDKVLFGAGETFKMSSGIYAEKACPLSRDLTGKWTARVAVKIMVVEGPLVKDIRYAQAVGEIEVEFQKPEGEDLAYINAVTDWLNKADPKTLKGYTAQAKSLTWGELLSSFRIPVPQMLLKNYPTSTYAGYELAKCAKENLHDYVNMSHEDIDEVLGVRGLIPEKQDAYRKERKKHFQDKLNLLQAFIAVHPDFVKADMIRSGISFYLLILGRQNEAMEEIKILSKMEGRWAEGARKALSMTCHEDEKVKTKTGEKSK
ncbi:MAG TPA: hypothetical protein PLA03_06410 [Acidobacteriota bacterium]|nr:hypothetical protein [Acidobacteriota bacterium]